MKESEFIRDILMLPDFEDAAGDKIYGNVYVLIGPDRIPIKRLEIDGHGDILIVVR